MRLLEDQGAWERVGRELRVSDPKSYIALLKVAGEICAIHRDPLAPIPNSYVLLSTRNPEDFD